MLIATILALMSASPAVAGPSDDKVQWRGFGEFDVSYYDYPEYFYRDRFTGDQRDHRVEAEISRVAFEGSKPLGGGWVVEGELSIHDQGVAGEQTPNYTGPFNEDQHGASTQGSMTLTKLLLARRFGENVSFYGGRIPVAFGQLSFLDTPMDYLGTRPFEVETDFIPEEWTDLGGALTYETGVFIFTGELVDGLDSTGFSSYRFVADGQQGRYGFVRATEPAYVARAEAAIGSLKAGASFYRGETTQNRPAPDMFQTCDNDNGTIGGCGYIHSPLTLLDAHAVYLSPTWRANVLALWGQLRNAADINHANDEDRTNLPVIFTPVGDKAYGAAGEVSYNLGAKGMKRLEPFVRYERLNTQWHVAKPTDRSPLADRVIVTGGVSSWLENGLYLKADYSKRAFLAPHVSYESTLTGAAGFKF